MFTQPTKICLRALAFLVTRERGEIVQSGEIAEKLGVSAAYVTKVFQPLCRAGWLQSLKGRAGGWKLSADPKHITLTETVRVLEPEDQWRRCVIGHDICSDDTACPFHDAWKNALEDLTEVMDRTTLSQLPGFLPPCFQGDPLQRAKAKEEEPSSTEG